MTSPVLALRDVTFRRNGTQILHGVDLTVHPGEHWAMLGPNGAGKSTLLGFCGARTHPTSGTVDLLPRRTPSGAQQARAAALVDEVGLAPRGGVVWPTLSQGERGRALIARALASGPRPTWRRFS